MRHGSNLNPANRFESVHMEPELEDLENDPEYVASLSNRRIEYIEDDSKSIVATNNSPDLPFNFSLNPYRGCIHGCSYCYARPGHEYLGFNAGMDFETKIVVKKNAPQLFRKFLSRKARKCESISFSGVTDCYQPAERQFQLTRQCLEIALEFNQPIGIVTKNALIARDIDLLSQMASRKLVHALISITTLDAQLARDMEPRTSIPKARLRTVRELSEAGIPTGVLVAPIVPGLNEPEIPAILNAAAEHGAITAAFIMLRLPLTVEPVFKEWLQRTRPDQASAILNRISHVRDGSLNDSKFGRRMTGSGIFADQIRKLFQIHKSKNGLDRSMPSYDCSAFKIPNYNGEQKTLFD